MPKGVYKKSDEQKRNLKIKRQKVECKHKIKNNLIQNFHTLLKSELCSGEVM